MYQTFTPYPRPHLTHLTHFTLLAHTQVYRQDECQRVYGPDGRVHLPRLHSLLRQRPHLVRLRTGLKGGYEGQVLGVGLMGGYEVCVKYV